MPDITNFFEINARIMKIARQIDQIMTGMFFEISEAVINFPVFVAKKIPGEIRLLHYLVPPVHVQSLRNLRRHEASSRGGVIRKNTAPRPAGASRKT